MIKKEYEKPTVEILELTVKDNIMDDTNMEEMPGGSIGVEEW